VGGGLTATLAAFAAGPPRAAIPENAREAVARSLLDTLAWGGPDLDASELTRCITALRYSRTVPDLTGQLLPPAARDSATPLPDPQAPPRANKLPN
jgi:hypothetical protein